MVDAGERGGDLAVVGAAFDRDASLADGRHELCRVEDLGDPVGEVEDLERGDRHHDRAADGDLRQPGLDVAAQLRELEVGTRAPRPGAAAAPTRWRPVAPAAMSIEAAADERVGSRATFAEGGQHEPVLGRRPQVLGRVHGQVGATVEHRQLDLLDEHALAADRVERARAGARRRSSRRTSSSTSRPASRSAAATSSAWVVAWALPRVASRSGLIAPTAGSTEVEQVDHGGGVALALRRAGLLA